MMTVPDQCFGSTERASTALPYHWQYTDTGRLSRDSRPFLPFRLNLSLSRLFDPLCDIPGIADIVGKVLIGCSFLRMLCSLMRVE